MEKVFSSHFTSNCFCVGPNIYAASGNLQHSHVNLCRIFYFYCCYLFVCFWLLLFCYVLLFFVCCFFVCWLFFVGVFFVYFLFVCFFVFVFFLFFFRGGGGVFVFTVERLYICEMAVRGSVVGRLFIL